MLDRYTLAQPVRHRKLYQNWAITRSNKATVPATFIETEHVCGKKGYPKLKGRASDIRGLDLSLWKCWKHFMDVESLQHQSIEMFLRLNVEAGTLLNEHGPRQGHFGMPSPFAEQAVQKGWLNYTSCLWNTLPIQSFNCPTAPANCTSCCIHWSWLNIVTHTSRGASRMKAIWESFSNCGSHAFQATNIVQSEM